MLRPNARHLLSAFLIFSVTATLTNWMHVPPETVPPQRCVWVTGSAERPTQQSRIAAVRDSPTSTAAGEQVNGSRNYGRSSLTATLSSAAHRLPTGLKMKEIHIKDAAMSARCVDAPYSQLAHLKLQVWSPLNFPASLRQCHLFPYTCGTRGSETRQVVGWRP